MSYQCPIHRNDIKNKVEEVNVLRKRYPNSKHLLPARQTAPEHPHEIMSNTFLISKQDSIRGKF